MYCLPRVKHDLPVFSLNKDNGFVNRRFAGIKNY